MMTKNQSRQARPHPTISVVAQLTRLRGQRLQPHVLIASEAGAVSGIWCRGLVACSVEP